MIFQSILGITIFIAIAILLSENPKTFSWRNIFGGIGVQLTLAILLIKLPPTDSIFLLVNSVVISIQDVTKIGTSFVFGYLGGGPQPFEIKYPESIFILAFQALPLLLIVSALSSLIFHWRILPAIISVFSWGLERIFKLGGSVGFATAANIFVGMVEAPILIKPYVDKLSRGELFVVMTAGMATIAGTVLILYATILEKAIPNAVSHILIASLISAPAAIMVAKLMVPDAKKTLGEISYPKFTNSIDAIAQGTVDGIKLLIHVIAMLIVAIALVALVNKILSMFPLIHGEDLTLQGILGWLMAPIAWLMGIPWDEASVAGSLLGIKVILNEFLAYIELARTPEEALSERSRLIMAYGLCGFANFGSLGIMIGGLITIAPKRREEIVSLGGKSIISGTLATCITGSIAGMLL